MDKIIRIDLVEKKYYYKESRKKRPSYVQ